MKFRFPIAIDPDPSAYRLDLSEFIVSFKISETMKYKAVRNAKLRKRKLATELQLKISEFSKIDAVFESRSETYQIPYDAKYRAGGVVILSFHSLNRPAQYRLI